MEFCSVPFTTNNNTRNLRFLQSAVPKSADCGVLLYSKYSPFDIQLLEIHSILATFTGDHFPWTNLVVHTLCIYYRRVPYGPAMLSAVNPPRGVYRFLRCKPPTIFYKYQYYRVTAGGLQRTTLLVHTILLLSF